MKLLNRRDSGKKCVLLSVPEEVVANVGVARRDATLPLVSFA